MKILVVFTGGTIGSSVSDGWIAPSDDMKYLLINNFRKKTGDNIHFDTVSPYTVLSENLSSEHINSLISCIRENISTYDGIIVTHGTDSLLYSASALAYACGTDSIPVVLVSSNYPLEDKRANGLDNFIGAVEFIKSGAGRGVFVSYRNQGEDTCIHLATRVATHCECFDEIYSIDKQPYAIYNGAVIVNPECNIYPCRGTEKISFSKKSGILSVTAMPGDSFSYNLSDYKAVILRPYHSGTLNTADESFLAFCKRASTSGIPVFVVNVSGGITYESSKALEKSGVVILPKSSFASVYMKIWLGLSINAEICSFLQVPLAAEFCDFKQIDCN